MLPELPERELAEGHRPGQPRQFGLASLGPEGVHQGRQGVDHGRMVTVQQGPEVVLVAVEQGDLACGVQPSGQGRDGAGQVPGAAVGVGLGEVQLGPATGQEVEEAAVEVGLVSVDVQVQGFVDQVLDAVLVEGALDAGHRGDDRLDELAVEGGEFSRLVLGQRRLLVGCGGLRLRRAGGAGRGAGVVEGGGRRRGLRPEVDQGGGEVAVELRVEQGQGGHQRIDSIGGLLGHEPGQGFPAALRGGRRDLLDLLDESSVLVFQPQAVEESGQAGQPRTEVEAANQIADQPGRRGGGGRQPLGPPLSRHALQRARAEAAVLGEDVDRVGVGLRVGVVGPEGFGRSPSCVPVQAGPERMPGGHGKGEWRERAGGWWRGPTLAAPRITRADWAAPDRCGGRPGPAAVATLAPASSLRRRSPRPARRMPP